MNRIKLCMPKLAFKIGLICMLLLPLLSKADINAIGEISNCYQRINLASGKNIKLLNIGGSPSISLYAGSTGTAFHYFTIQQYNPALGTYHYLSFPGPYIWLIDSAHGGDSVQAYPNNFSTFRSTIPLTNSGSLIINLYVRHQAIPGGPFTYAISNQDITVDFVGVDAAFNFKPQNQTCFTYDNFQIKRDASNLEGLCNTPSYRLTLPSGVPNRMGVIEPYSHEIYFGNDAGVVASDDIDIPIDQNRCLSPEYSCATSPSAPCNCIDFNIDITLYSCNMTDPNCAQFITVSKPIKICCNCGYQEPELPTLGRQTTSTALTGDNSELTIFPNPNQSGKLQVSASGNPLQNIKIYTVDGKLVKNVTVKEGVSQVSVDISNLQPGIYQVKVLDNANTVSNKKLIVQ